MKKSFEQKLLEKKLIRNLQTQIWLNEQLFECINDEEEYKYYKKLNEKLKKQIKEIEGENGDKIKT